MERALAVRLLISAARNNTPHAALMRYNTSLRPLATPGTQLVLQKHGGEPQNLAIGKDSAWAGFIDQQTRMKVPARKGRLTGLRKTASRENRNGLA